MLGKGIYMFKEVSIHTKELMELIDITDVLEKFKEEHQMQDGVLTVFVPHTTAGITINENADPTVKRDIIYKLREMVPVSDDYRHLEGNSHAHVKSTIYGVSESIIVHKGELMLGTWQGVYFCEFDGPRERKIYLKYQGN